MPRPPTRPGIRSRLFESLVLPPPPTFLASAVPACPGSEPALQPLHDGDQDDPHRSDDDHGYEHAVDPESVWEMMISDPNPVPTLIRNSASTIPTRARGMARR